jgi:type IV pilus assembly protein PilX
MKRSNHNAQRGAVLIIALLFLTILTILGVTAMTATTFEERMAGNTRDVGVAFQAAEAALRDARRDINGILIPPPNTNAAFTAAGGAVRMPPISGKTGFGDGTDADNGACGQNVAVATPQTRGLCRPTTYDATAGIAPPFNAIGLQALKHVDYGTFTGAPELRGLSAQPLYYIEVLCYPQYGGSIGETTYCNFYRITGRGFGTNPNTRVTVQEIFLKP